MDNTSAEKPPITFDILEEITALELNNRIASLSVFRCKRCWKFLKQPILLVKIVGNVCGSCAFAEEYRTATRNSALELILQNLVISCSNEKRGCKEKSVYSDMLTHDLICNYRDYTCLAKLSNKDCNWKGILSDLIVHTSTRHKACAVEGYNNSFKFNIDVFHNDEVIRLLFIDDKYLILRFQCNTAARVVQYIMYYLERKENDSGISYTISQTHNSISRSTSHTTFSYEKYYAKNFDTQHTVSINLPEVLIASKPTTVQLLLDNAEQPDDKLIKFLDCNVCKDVMKPPIYQCVIGHSVCSACNERLKQCPLCQSAYSGTRNFSLEALCDNIKLSCTYREYGCRKLLSVSEVEQHQRTCSSKPYNCPLFEECDWQSAFSEVGNHIQTCHKEKLIYNNYTKRRFGFPVDLLDTFFMAVGGKIFRICHKQDKETKHAYWIVQVVSQTNEEREYKYEIGLINTINGIQTHVKSDVCQSLYNSNMFRKAIKFSYSDVSLFSSKDEFTYYCKITKLT